MTRTMLVDGSFSRLGRGRSCIAIIVEYNEYTSVWLHRTVNLLVSAQEVVTLHRMRCRIHKV